MNIRSGAATGFLPGGMGFFRNNTYLGIRTKSREKGSKLKKKGTNLTKLQASRKTQEKGTKPKKKGTKLTKRQASGGGSCPFAPPPCGRPCIRLI